MDFKKELMITSLNFDSYKDITTKLPRPKWLTAGDGLYSLYEEKDILLKEGKVCYAYLLQANEVLFSYFPHVNAPAAVIYSDDDIITEEPSILEELAECIMSYKDSELFLVPPKFREIVKTITDEYSRKRHCFFIEHKNRKIKIYYSTVMIFRKHIPGRKINHFLLPILMHRACKNVMILPKEYWSEGLKKIWK